MNATPTIRIPNWHRFQHFKDRDPIWIKLYRELRHKREWRVLPGDAAKLLVDLWMLASESSEQGVINLISTDLSFELRADSATIDQNLQVLADSKLIELDNVPISSGYQGDIPRALAREEKRREENTPAEGCDEYSAEFNDWWSRYPRKVSKKTAYKAWRARIREGVSVEDLDDGLARYLDYIDAEGTEDRYIKHPATFLGPDRHWEEDWEPTRQVRYGTLELAGQW